MNATCVLAARSALALVNFCSSMSGGGQQYHLAGMLFTQKFFLGSSYFTQWKALCNQWTNFIFFNVGNEVFKDPVFLVGAAKKGLIL